jgi:hypothetical protein
MTEPVTFDKAKRFDALVEIAYLLFFKKNKERYINYFNLAIKNNILNSTENIVTYKIFGIKIDLVQDIEKRLFSRFKILNYLNDLYTGFTFTFKNQEKQQYIVIHKTT